MLECDYTEEEVIAAFVGTRELMDFTNEYFEVEDRSYIDATFLLGLQKRMRECAHFSKKLTDRERPILISQADVILNLVRSLWKGQPALLGPLEEAVAFSQEKLDKLAPIYELGALQFEEY